MIVELIGPSTRDAGNIAADPSRLINCYRSPGGGGAVSIVPVLGMQTPTEFAEDGVTQTGDGVRAMAEIEGVLYVVKGGCLWTVNDAGGQQYCGDLVDSTFTSICGNNGNVCIVAGGNYYVWNGVSVSEPAAGAFSEFGSVAFLGQATILTERDGRRVQWSDLADATTLNALNFATTESRDDDNLRAMVFGSELWIFKRKSIERWYQDETGGFSAIPGSTIDKGLAGFRFVTEGEGSGFFVSTDGKAYVVGPGGAIEQVSTTAVHDAIANGSVQSCFYYQDQGHEFYAIAFADRPAWCFDLTTGEWHERAEGVEEPWTARHAAFAYGFSHVGTDDGFVHVLQRGDDNFPAVGDYDTNGNPRDLIRRIVTRTVVFDGQRRKITKIGFPMRTGYADFTASLFVSRDRGITWSDPKDRTASLGDYSQQMTWRSLGQCRYANFELRMSDNVYVAVNASMIVETA